MGLINEKGETVFFFLGGILLFGLMILLLRYYYLYEPTKKKTFAYRMRSLSKKYYNTFPSHIVTPVIIIAAGIFAIIITGANRQVLNDKMLLNDGGTGGYLLWAESAIPIKEDLNHETNRRNFGFGSEEFRDLFFVQCRRVLGDDASCLNLNHVTSPPILSVDPQSFISRGSFSFVSRLRKNDVDNTWALLDERPGNNTVYGIADQTVLKWGLMLNTGDTIKVRAENGQVLNIIICGGLRSSVFQGHLLIGSRHFSEYFPSVSGSSILLIDGNPQLSELYINMLNERLSGFGLSVQTAAEKLSSFFIVTNTYLDVFVILGVFGLLLGITGLGFVLLRNYNLRKHEFALLSALGFSLRSIRRYTLSDQILILIAGIITGTLSGFAATWPSLRAGNSIPWKILFFMVIAIFATGFISLLVSVRKIENKSLVSQLRRE
jgi:hypothetical protein